MTFTIAHSICFFFLLQIPLLVSGVFHSLLTRPIADKCRRIDVVKVKGSAQPMPLYCFDIFAGYLEELRPKLVCIFCISVLFD